MQRFDDSVSKYILDHTSPEDELLTELERETNLKVLRARMVSGHLQGKVLEMISYMIKPQNILELGTYTGYSAICLAKGLKPGGMLHTIDINDELETITSKYIQKSGYADKIIVRFGNALEIIPSMNIMFDLVFIDADKREYPDYYNMIIDKVTPGGFILADDVLWYGKANMHEADDAYTQGIMDFNKMIQNDSRVENVMLPIRDGIMVIRKK